MENKNQGFTYIEGLLYLILTLVIVAASVGIFGKTMSSMIIKKNDLENYNTLNQFHSRLTNIFQNMDIPFWSMDYSVKKNSQGFSIGRIKEGEVLLSVVNGPDGISLIYEGREEQFKGIVFSDCLWPEKAAERNLFDFIILFRDEEYSLKVITGSKSVFGIVDGQ